MLSNWIDAFVIAEVRVARRETLNRKILYFARLMTKIRLLANRLTARHAPSSVPFLPYDYG